MPLEKQKKVGDRLFLTAFAIFFVVSNIMVSAAETFIPNGIVSLIKYTCILAILIKILFMTKFTLQDLLLIIPIATIIGIGSIRSGKNVVLFGLIFLIGSKNVPIRTIVKVFFYSSLFLIVGLFILSIIGVIPNSVYYRGVVPRYSFGSNYPTDFGAHVFYLLTAAFFLRGKKYATVDLVYSFFIALFIWKYCDARLDAGLVIFLSVGLYLIVHHNFNFSYFRDSWYSLLSLSYVVCSFFIVLLTVRYNPLSAVYRRLDSLLSQRLSIGHIGFNAYNIKLFGQAIEQHGWGGVTGTASGYVYFFLDSSYIDLLLVYGLLTMIIFVGAYTYISFRRLNQGYIILIFILAVIAVSGIVDQHIFDLAFNPFLYIFWDSSFNNVGKDFGQNFESLSWR